jgi:transposase InsO family protein
MKLLAQGIRLSKDRVQRLMKLHGIKAKTKRRFKATTDSNHNLPVAPKPAATRLLACSPQSGLEYGHHLRLD